MCSATASDSELQDASDEVIVTRDFLTAGLSGNGGWNLAQMYCLGMSWPPESGWVDTVLGARIPKLLADEFFAARGVKRSFKAAVEIAERHQLPFCCSSCKQWFQIDEFEPHRRPSRGRKAWCRACCDQASIDTRLNARIDSLHPSQLSHGYSYISRGFWLRQIGFGSYREYLESDLWRLVRARVYSVKGYKCYLCGAPAQAVHHNRYHRNDLLGRRLKFLSPVCNACHETIEFSHGTKLEVRQVAKRFNKHRRRHLSDSNEMTANTNDDSQS